MKNDTLTKKEAARILAKAWNNLDASLIEPYIAEDIIYWSQQVLTDMTGKKAVMGYLICRTGRNKNLPNGTQPG